MFTTDDSNKIVWAYMIEHGSLTNGEWSYYANDWEPAPNCLINIISEYKDFKDKVRTVGVDWANTSMPFSYTKSAFTNTLHAGEIETLLGTIVLKDRSKYTVGVKGTEFGKYVNLIREYMENKEKLEGIFGV